MNDRAVKKRILFVCSGNVFRSLAAELCLRKYIAGRSANWEVRSAGTVARPEPIDPQTRAALHRAGIKPVRHRQHKLERRALANADMVVAMATYHRDFIRQHFGYRQVKLFNELAVGRPTSVWDVNDVVKDYLTNRPAMTKHIHSTVRYICRHTPQVYRRLAVLLND